MSTELEDRTYKFSEEVIALCRALPKNPINNPLMNQLIRSATSIGANYCEANAAASKKDFKNKIFICKKEAQETNYWLRLIESSNLDFKNTVSKLRTENNQFVLIFGKIVSTLNNKSVKT
jgi:four helix bundle protein